MEKIKSDMKPKDGLDAALGSVLGAFAGDSIGSYLEFATIPINQESVNYALTFPGGGPHRVDAGQITDDSELGICLAHALAAVFLLLTLSVTREN